MANKENKTSKNTWSRNVADKALKANDPRAGQAFGIRRHEFGNHPNLIGKELFPAKVSTGRFLNEPALPNYREGMFGPMDRSTNKRPNLDSRYLSPRYNADMYKGKIKGQQLGLLNRRLPANPLSKALPMASKVPMLPSDIASAIQEESTMGVPQALQNLMLRQAGVNPYEGWL